jgi:hypothetical protein
MSEDGLICTNLSGDIWSNMPERYIHDLRISTLEWAELTIPLALETWPDS